MKCPKCGENTAFLYSEDGLEKGIHEVEIRCGGECQKKQMEYYDLDKTPATVATVDVQVIIKRGTIKLYDD